MRHKYTLTGYTAEGNKKEVTFGAGKELRERAFLKVSTKGTFVEEWEEVQVEELPKQVKSKFE